MHEHVECGNGFGSSNLLTALYVHSSPDRQRIIKMLPAALRDKNQILAYTCKVSSSLVAWPTIVRLALMHVAVHHVQYMMYLS